MSHEAWDKFAWLLPLERREEPWYWCALRAHEPEERKLPSDAGFLSTVDPALRPLVSWLHAHGIPTGPSCAGHDISTKGFRQIYEDLERDAESVRDSGLVLRDPEEGQNYVMRDPHFELPWRSFDSFRKAANEHQPIGWLPFYTTDPRVELAVGTGPGFEVKTTGPGCYSVKTTGKNPDAWKTVTKVLKGALS